MAIVNRIEAFAESRGDSVYRLIQRAGISNTTGYALKNNPLQIPDGATLNAICGAYQCQPGDLLQYVPDEGEGE